jgi:hypothetical protein
VPVHDTGDQSLTRHATDRGQTGNVGGRWPDEVQRKTLYRGCGEY